MLAVSLPLNILFAFKHYRIIQPEKILYLNLYRHYSFYCSILFFSTTFKFVFTACEPGYYGIFCNVSCPPGTFGDKCGGRCFPECTMIFCHHVKGCQYITYTSYTPLIGTILKSSQLIWWKITLTPKCLFSFIFLGGYKYQIYKCQVTAPSK